MFALKCPFCQGHRGIPVGFLLLRYSVLFTVEFGFIKKQQKLQNKKEGKDQESIQSSTTTDPGYQWESDKVTIRHHKRVPRGQPFSQQVTTRHQQTDVNENITKQDRNNINDPQKKHRLGTVSKNILPEGLNQFNGAPTSPLVQMWIKISKGAKIRNRYNQVPHLTQDTNGKVTNSQLDTINESQDVRLIPAGDHIM